MSQNTYRICPVCSMSNPPDSEICQFCYRPLNSESAETFRFIESGYDADLTLPVRPVQDGYVHLLIAGHPKKFVLKNAATILLGRPKTVSFDAHLIDLTPYGAVEHGVSRQHALIRQSRGAWDSYTVTDLSSTNGTQLNGKPLMIATSYPLQNGDQIQLGRMVLYVYFTTEYTPGDQG